MDIHPPHPIHSWKDFGVQLITITAGILIALSLEGVRESIHDRALVREARENIHREITDNQREVENEITAIPARSKKIDNALRFANEMLKTKRTDIQVVTVRSILLTEGQLATAAIARYKKALE